MAASLDALLLCRPAFPLAVVVAKIPVIPLADSPQSPAPPKMPPPAASHSAKTPPRRLVQLPATVLPPTHTPAQTPHPPTPDDG